MRRACSGDRPRFRFAPITWATWARASGGNTARISASPVLMPADARDTPELGEEPRPIGVHGQCGGIVDLDAASATGDDRPAFEISDDAVAAGQRPQALSGGMLLAGEALAITDDQLISFHGELHGRSTVERRKCAVLLCTVTCNKIGNVSQQGELPEETDWSQTKRRQGSGLKWQTCPAPLIPCHTSAAVVMRDALTGRSELLRENGNEAGVAQPRITRSLAFPLLGKCLCSGLVLSERLLGPLVIDSGDVGAATGR